MSKRAEILSAVYADARLNVANPELAISAYARHTKMKIQVFDGNDLEAAFEDGYEQAEKDFALTWVDVAKIITIYEAGIDNGDYRRYNDAEWMKEYSQDILRKFNEQIEK